MAAVRWRSTARWSIRRSMKMKRSWRLHEEERIALHHERQIAIARPLFWWRSGASHDTTCPKMSRSLSLLNPSIGHVLVMEIGWTLCPPHQCASHDAPWIRRLLGRHASCAGKKRVGHSPTRRKYFEKTRLNRGVQLSFNCVTAPLSYQGPTILVGPPYANLPLGAPHDAHVEPAWSRGPPATWPRTVSLLRPAWATHGSATWPQRRVAPMRWSRAPRVSSLELPLATSAPAGNKPPFSRFS